MSASVRSVSCGLCVACCFVGALDLYRFEVYDKDTLGKDDFLGRAEVELPVENFAGELEVS